MRGKPTHLLMFLRCLLMLPKKRFHKSKEILTGVGRGISTGREGPVAPVPEPVLPFRD